MICFILWKSPSKKQARTCYVCLFPRANFVFVCLLFISAIGTAEVVTYLVEEEEDDLKDVEVASRLTDIADEIPFVPPYIETDAAEGEFRIQPFRIKVFQRNTRPTAI